METLSLAGAGVRLAASAAGSAGDPVVLLLHGGGQTRHSWGAATRALGRSRTRCVALDLRGHGDSDWAPDGDYSVAAFAADVVEVQQQLALPVVLVGASLGGMVGALVAAQLGPERVCGLVLVDVVLRARPEGVRRIVDFMTGAPDGFDSLEAAAEAIASYLPHRPQRGVTPGLRNNLRRRSDGRWVWHWDPKFLAGRVPGEARPPGSGLEDAVRRLTIPVALVRGRLSDIVDDEGVEELRTLVPQLRVYDVAGAAHTAAADDNDAFVEAVRDYLGTIGACIG
ncbi:alpha/beta fold hydrolase [Sporichthya polymorpha]|uniref:alpha/beta fold hydrolase n=1 Tax=Sporichthya polymorpha TaxID=35751 RepID=UPI000366DBE4|nr:alpha/beta hydrolase [Sporichthya polymorpha]